MPYEIYISRKRIKNSLIHRKYWIPGSVKIALFDNRLEIFSPGNFPGLIDFDHLGDDTTYLRNPHLAKLARSCRMSLPKLTTNNGEISFEVFINENHPDEAGNLFIRFSPPFSTDLNLNDLSI